MHILSPYPAHRTALTDCTKITGAGFDTRTAVVIFGDDYTDWPMDPAIDAFETLASPNVVLGHGVEAAFEGLLHPVHTRGRVFGWQVETTSDPAHE